ncbi:hypothetical protein ASPWEDRAFT_147128 [Aspergillus wentii DTO 134E9]|uniref:Tyrosinase copper-binding domain-containing protein n=1 Tax=Aspergillus wentii DTO 134E9 TaxID=1073089 RepID=A0A1L9S2T4_ASPWE|nr:uncharacterized protein ASPWEDRAFT_147128 [Aspergillus wentii DTO 134E9]KAI9929822.1 hypothetical protein MW887_011627 [Aspergillus wentii]OJJ41474.1 hypothetical protein ASPWEDRAFT_147128 [Aspergillus wentii DTO 134E9]
MRLSLFTTLATLAAVIPSLAIPDHVDSLSHKGLANLRDFEASHSGKTCTLENAAVRREWGSLSPADRKKYTDAMLCLMSKPPRFSRDKVPGARNRYDDFVAVHINQTMTIHGTGNFLTWHRYFTWTFEQALRNECGYDGYQPYWAWEKYAHDPIHSPVFDGSEFSLSGNGEYVPHNGTPATAYTTLPAGRGGGCVTTGPFKNMTVNLGPVSPTLQVPGIVAQNGSGFDYNPRCLRRDISVDASMGWTKDSDVAGLIKNYTTIDPFQTTMQGNFPAGYLGVHTAGHFTIGGDPGGDLFVSPGDPAFFVHHAMIDRVFWIWQNLDPANRRDKVSGTITMMNTPPSRNATLDDIVDLDLLAEPYRLGDLLDTTAGPFCYVYT